MNLEPGPAEIFWQAAPFLLHTQSPSSEVCFQPTGSCVSQALSAAFPPKSRFRALGSVRALSPKTRRVGQLLSVGCRAFLTGGCLPTHAAQPGKSLAESVAGQRTSVSPGEDSAGISHVDLGFPGGSSPPLAGI